MPKLKTLLFMIASPLILAGCLHLPGTQESQPTTQTAPASESQTSETEVMTKEETSDSSASDETYTLEMVAEHDSPDDCWIAIEGKVYDVSPFIAGGQHPGGAAILQGCGIDATELYNDRPNGSGAHSEQARSFLPDYYIGDLAQ